MLDVIARLFDARSRWILLHDPSINRLVTCAFKGPGADAYAGAELPPDRGIVGLAFTCGETMFVPDVQDEHRWYDAERVRRSGLQSIFTVPLVHGELRMGVVGLDSARFSAEHPPSAADRARFWGPAAQAALAISNAKLVEQLEADRTRLRVCCRSAGNCAVRWASCGTKSGTRTPGPTIIGESEPRQRAGASAVGTAPPTSSA